MSPVVENVAGVALTGVAKVAEVGAGVVIGVVLVGVLVVSFAVRVVLTSAGNRVDRRAAAHDPAAPRVV